MTLGLAALDGACQMYDTAVKQQLLRQGGLTGIRVGDDGKGAALAYLTVKFFLQC